MINEIKSNFWEYVNISNYGIVLRSVKDDDKESFLLLQEENALSKRLIKEDEFRNSLWEEHNEEKCFMFSIIVNKEYVGYCGIKNITLPQWEVAIEILEKWKNKGIGYNALCMLFDALKERLNKNCFRVRVFPSNVASQALFNKLGAIPNGISEYWLHGDMATEYEEENLSEIDEQIEILADQFGVEPRKLLSHVLEYKIIW